MLPKNTRSLRIVTQNRLLKIWKSMENLATDCRVAIYIFSRNFLTQISASKWFRPLCLCCVWNLGINRLLEKFFRQFRNFSSLPELTFSLYCFISNSKSTQNAHHAHTHTSWSKFKFRTCSTVKIAPSGRERVAITEPLIKFRAHYAQPDGTYL